MQFTLLTLNETLFAICHVVPDDCHHKHSNWLTSCHIIMQTHPSSKNPSRGENVYVMEPVWLQQCVSLLN